MKSVPPRHEIPEKYTWDVASIFPDAEAWGEAFRSVEHMLPALDRFRGRLAESPAILADWFDAAEQLGITLGKIFLYASSNHNVDTADQAAAARHGRALALSSRVAAATAFAEPEILAIGQATLQRWMTDEPRLAIYQHYVERLESRREHVRSAEVEEVLGLVRDPFATASATARVLSDTDLSFEPVATDGGEEIGIAQGNINALLTDVDRDVRRSAWENYADAYLAMKNTFANALSAGVKQDVFTMRTRRYGSSLEAALAPNHIPTDVFHNLIDTYRRHLPIWHRYWKLRREALGYDTLHVYDIKAPLSSRPLDVPYEQAVAWIVEGMQPLGEDYVTALQRGLNEERWVDVMPNQGKRGGAYSSGTPGTHPFILMSYNDDLFSMSTLAHELGHSLHSYFSTRTQPFVYARYGLFLAETASNFNQALVRAYLLDSNSDPDFQISVIEEAMSNFHRYFFVMPALARFELEIHQRVERGEALNAESLNTLMTDLFREGYGDEVEIDPERVGITWGQFPGHLFMNFYVYQYATGISAANALAQGVLTGGRDAAERYLTFLRSGGSMYPLDTLRLAGVDMATPEPIERAFGVMESLVDRLAGLLRERSPVSA